MFLWVAGVAWIVLTGVGVLNPEGTGFTLDAVGVLTGFEAVVFEFFESQDESGTLCSD